MSILAKINEFKRKASKVNDFSESIGQGARGVHALLTGEINPDARINTGLPAINQISGNLNTGINKPSRYAVYLTPPRILANQNTSYLLFRTTTAELPGLTINRLTTKPLGYGNARNLPTALNIFPDITIEFLASADQREYKFFSAWTDGIVKRPNDKAENTKGFHTVNYLHDYSCNMSIVLYSETGDSVYECFFNELYPVQVNPIPLSWDANDQAFRFSITFAYTNWYDRTIRDSIETKFPKILGGIDTRIGSQIAGALNTGFSVFGVQSTLPTNVSDALNVITGGGLLDFT